MRLQPISIVFGLFLIACGAQHPIVASRSAQQAAGAPSRRAAAADARSESDARISQPEMPSHAVGDYLIRAFTLPSRTRVTVTERVVAVKDTSVVVEVTREVRAKTRSIRVELNDAPGRRGEILEVTVLRGGAELPRGKAAYDAIMRGTEFAVDENEGQIDSADTKLDVRGRALECTETRFRVRVRGQEATMRTVQLANSPWGEVAADVTTPEGATLYRAEVLDVGHEELRTAAVAEH
ncbi:MAG TPA: hypothetical protein VF881_17205 [Polyangiaceae bacterium]